MAYLTAKGMTIAEAAKFMWDRDLTQDGIMIPTFDKGGKLSKKNNVLRWRGFQAISDPTSIYYPASFLMGESIVGAPIKKLAEGRGPYGQKIGMKERVQSAAWAFSPAVGAMTEGIMNPEKLPASIGRLGAVRTEEIKDKKKTFKTFQGFKKKKPSWTGQVQNLFSGRR